MTDTLDRVLPVTLTVCAALGLVAIVASVLAAAIHDMKTATRLRRLKGKR